MKDQIIKRINEAIETCYWRKDVGGVFVCTAEIASCDRIIDGGKCYAIKEIFKSQEN